MLWGRRTTASGICLADGHRYAKWYFVQFSSLFFCLQSILLLEQTGSSILLQMSDRCQRSCCPSWKISPIYNLIILPAGLPMFSLWRVQNWLIEQYKQIIVNHCFCLFVAHCWLEIMISIARCHPNTAWEIAPLPEVCQKNVWSGKEDFTEKGWNMENIGGCLQIQCSTEGRYSGMEDTLLLS